MGKGRLSAILILATVIALTTVIATTTTKLTPIAPTTDQPDATIAIRSLKGSPPQAAWNKTYGGTSDDEAYSVQQTSDGGYIIAGYTDSSGAGSSDFWLVKTDSSGNQQWNKTYGGTMFDRAYSVQQTSDGGYITAGITDSSGAGGGDLWLVKTDSSGNHEWNKTYGGTSYDEARSVQQTSDGGYIAAGDTKSFGAGGGWENLWLVKTDSSGNHEWNTTYGGTGRDVAYSVQQTSDGGYITAGLTNFSGAGYDDFWLVKTYADGTMQWNKTFGGVSTDAANSVQQTADGGYIVAGSTYSYGGWVDFWLVKTDSSGNQQWNKTYGGSGAEGATSVQLTSDGAYIVAGYTDSSGAGGYDFWLVKTNDATPPSTITNLAAGSPTSDSITLTWIAPGDEWNKGNATGYVVKYSTVGSITAENWSSATTYTQSWKPAKNGTIETQVVDGLTPRTQYWFAVEAYDEMSDYGEVSNSPSATTLAPPEYLKVGVKAGDTANYTIQARGYPDNTLDALYLVVDSVSGTLVTLNGTTHYSNGSTYFGQITGDISIGSNGIYVYLIAANLTAGQPIYFGSLLSITSTIPMNTGGVARIVNQYYVYVPAIALLDLRWDRLTGLMVKYSVWSETVSLNITLTSTSLWKDVTPPDAISNLAASNPTGTSITLSWTAPGDNGSLGTASGYIVKYSTLGLIDSSSWDSATTYDQNWAPVPAGSTETHVISGLASETQYWFAVKAYDDAWPPNYGDISNSPYNTTLTLLSLRTIDWSGSILPSCTVNLTEVGSVVSDSNGWANFSGVPDGTYDVVVRWCGSKVNQTSVTMVGSYVAMNVRCRVWNLAINARDAAGMPLQPNNMQIYVTFPNGTHANPANVNSVTWKVQNGTYYFAVRWQGSWVYGNWSIPLDVTDTTRDLWCEIYSLSFTFRDDSGGLTVNPTSWGIKAPNGTVCTIAGAIAQAQNGTWELVSVRWQGGNVVPSAHPTADLPGVTLPWTVYLQIYEIDQYTFKDNSGSLTLSPVTSYTLRYPNGTLSTLSGNPSLYIQNGSTELYSVYWQGNNIVPSPHPSFDAASGNPTFNCRVYQRSFTFRDNSGALTISPNNWRIIAPNGTMFSFTGNPSIYLQNGTTELYSVYWQGNNIVPSPHPTSDAASGNLAYNCRVYQRSFTFRDNSGALTISPTSWAITAPNGTLFVFTGSTSIYLQNGTAVLLSVYWQGNNTVPSTPPTFDAADGNPSFNCRVYQLSFTFKDNGGTSLYRNPSQITLRCPNGTGIVVTSYSDIFAQNGTYRITGITWNGIDVVASPNPSFSLTGSGSQDIQCLVYDLGITVKDEYGLPIAGATVRVTLPNGTTVSAQTGVSGMASFPQCPQGSFNTTASYLTKTNSTTGDVSQTYSLMIDIPPAAIADLAASSPTNSSITLTWTAPGRGGTNGNTTGYIVKYSTSGPITEANWNSATTYVQSWTPARNGTTEVHLVSGLTPGTQYWFAIKAYDDASPSNYAVISNSASGTTTGGGGFLTTELLRLVIIVAVVGSIAAAVIVKIRSKPRKPSVESLPKL